MLFISEIPSCLSRCNCADLSPMIKFIMSTHMLFGLLE